MVNMTLRPNSIDAGACDAPKTRVCGAMPDSSVLLGLALVCITASLTSAANAEVGVQNSESHVLASEAPVASDDTSPVDTSPSTLTASEAIEESPSESATTQASAGSATNSPHPLEPAVSPPEST